METPLPAIQLSTELISELRSADRRYLKTLFRDCPPPAVGNLLGEFDAELLHQGGRLAGLITKMLFGSAGNWIGKAFCPTSSAAGVGYNCFLRGTQVVPNLPMDFFIASSEWDGGLSLVIDYRRHHWGLLRWLRGEVRQVAPGMLLGMGAFGPRFGKRDLFRRKIPFLMTGPVRSYQFPQLANQPLLSGLARQSAL